jgi:uncharacterized protein (TIGR03067 family)
MYTTLFAVLAVGAIRGADEKESASGEVLARLAGTWDVVYVERGGHDQTKKGVTATFNKNGVALKGGGHKEDLVKLTLDPSKKPGWAEIEMPTTDGKSVKLRGVYRVSTNHFWICFNPDPAGKRPLSIETMNTANVLFVLKRPKK